MWGKKEDSGGGDQSLLISPGSEASCGAIDLKIAIGLLWQPLGQFAAIYMSLCAFAADD